jgi:hypothetical protein
MFIGLRLKIASPQRKMNACFQRRNGRATPRPLNDR